ncbi:carboxylating nicotinate-nucleotide diphosphorylase [Stieleria sp. JC731]|uniref:carboxylating nicotinate-nucleotide diphosphorylase n=1 Tax=Pirellulaceae TaxID=2691357 RepID=UPI001E643C2A|nr:carboxylating nicotinate-nucleotide diphosphorylase [Stieleria sp. JC731]MCC9602369.1 carboxylating nicotinate-nucleotide diphosphorylase [Stieleria sp. JC731]
MQDYVTVTADDALENDVRLLVRLAIAEDLAGSIDWTTVCMVDADQKGGCQIVPRGDGVCAGMAILPWIVDEFDADLEFETLLADGQRFTPGQPIAKLRGNVRDLLTSERTILNLISRASGVATLVRQYVDAIEGLKANVYDTRKTTPGWRLLEKYSVACGGGRNHRRGLYDGFLIKDNHLQLAGKDGCPVSPSEAAKKALQWRGGQVEHLTAPSIVEIEVDSLEQLRDVLPVSPDIVLIDNFAIEDIHAAVKLRDELNPQVELEVSGNVKLDTIVEIAKTGVERISSGALTHQATWLDLGLDWLDTRG